MARRLTITSLLIVTLSFIGCEAQYHDVSQEAPHKERIGQICVLKEQVRAHGVTRKVEREKKTDYVLVSELRFTGPEFTFVESIPAEAKLRIISARECHCLFQHLVQYRVEIQPSLERLVGFPTYVRQSSVTSNVLHCGARAA